MRYSRRIRFLAALVALMSLLFTQLALAGYDCPKPAQQVVTMQAEAAGHNSCCTPHDQQSPNLCEAHVQSSAQSLDLPAHPLVAPFVPAGLMVSLARVELLLPPNLDSPLSFLASDGSAPPIPIRHCCLRN
jgi:hypothetical protein